MTDTPTDRDEAANDDAPDRGPEAPDGAPTPALDEPGEPDRDDEPTSGDGPSRPDDPKRAPYGLALDDDGPSVGATAAILVAAALAILFAVSNPPPTEPVSDAPEHVVAFFDEIRAGNVADALDMIDASPSGEASRFLRPDAIDDGWAIESVEETSLYEYDGESESVVEFVMVVDGVETPGSLSLTRERPDDEWLIEMDLAEVVLERPYFDHVEVNGVTAPVDVTNADEADPVAYLLLPGVYRLFEEGGGLYDVDGGTIVVTPGGAAPAQDFSVTLTADGEARLQEAVNAFVDECARIPVVDQTGCPFGDAYLDDPRQEGYYLDVVTDVTWTVEEYPVVTGTMRNWWITVVPRENGTATITATGTEREKRPGVPVDVTAECAIDPSGLRAWFSVDDRVVVVPDPSGIDEPETCGE